MKEGKYDFGMIGLGVMGRNFLLNVADSGFSVAGLDKDAEKAKALEAEAEDRNAFGTTSMAEFVGALKTPRKIMLLVPAGKVVDFVINDLLDHVSEGDLIIDGGNTYFEDTDRRIGFLKDKGILFLGVGVSGGAKGARLGPSIMPGGNPEAYEIVKPILEEVAAKVDGEPCVDYMGNGSAGHYVKMVHNGIEYGMMQLLAESYDLMKQVASLSNDQMHQIYSKWNNSNLQSFLVEITAAIFDQSDELEPGDLVDKIMDKAKQKGTGKWTSQHAMDMGIPVPTIDAAVTMRKISGMRDERLNAAKHLDIPLLGNYINPENFVSHMEHALTFAFIMSYAQGLNLLAETSEERGYDLNMERIARIWRGGCIIRASLLEDIRKAFDADPKLRNLLQSPVFKERLLRGQESCREILKAGIDRGIPTLTFSSALAYFDAYRSARLPLNLVQAQRDFFGSHTYERVDRDGVFHTEWE